MSETPFIHLHCHTDYSLLDGACEIGRMMDVVAEQKAPAIAMTDHGNLFGAMEFYNGANAIGVKPIIGCELYVTQQSSSIKNQQNRYNHLLLLCENEEGYRNLIQLVTASYLDGFYVKPRVDKDLLARHSKGLICLSGCLRGDVNEALLEGRFDRATELTREYQDMFGKQNYFLEIQDHGLEADKLVIPQLEKLVRHTGIPLVATNDAHYLRHSDSHAHEVMLCIQTGRTFADANRMRFDTTEFYLKTRAEMLRTLGGFESALDLTWDIAQRCNLKLKPVSDPFPRFPIPDGQTTDSYFALVAREGFERRRLRLEQLAETGQLRYPLPVYEERLEMEIRTIQQMKFAGYFLIVWDFIRYARDKHIPVGPGRGSAAGSLVSYAMGITDIDPLQYNLLFERFLNPERISMPDIDIDFCTRGRGEVIRHVTELYGREQVAQIITFGTLGARAAIKDVGRVLGMKIPDVDKLTKLVPTQPLNIKLKQALEMEPRLKEATETDRQVKDLLDTAMRLEGMSRNASIHAAGVVISPQPLRELVPLYKTNKDEVVTQYDMSGLEKLGLLKMDFLGLTTLTIIDDCLKIIGRYRNINLQVEDIPFGDEKTYREVFASGATSGIFQFESDGMRDILRRYVPTRLEDLIALNALYRPGPMDMIDDFIERRHGRSEVTYELPEMKTLLEETYGVMVYQEQVMQMANVLAGYSLGDADLLRRAMGKKKKEEMAQQRERFLAGAAKKKLPLKKVEKVFDQMEKFAGYGFNKSHSAAYAYLAYVTGYLKANYPVEFMSALLTSETGNTTKVVRYINECRSQKIAVLPPGVNSSGLNFTPDGEAVRFGLGAIRNVGETPVNAILAARDEGGPFQSIYEFCRRVDMGLVNRRVLESLIRAGALDQLKGSRTQLLAVLDKAIEEGTKSRRDRESGQVGLFGELMAESQDDEDNYLPNLPPPNMMEALAFEKDLLGFYVSGHPLDAHRVKVMELATHTSDHLEGVEGKAEVAMCGLLSSLNVRRQKETNKEWASLSFEDLAGTMDAMIFPKALEGIVREAQNEESDPMQRGKITAREAIPLDQPVYVRGRILQDEGSLPKLSIQSIQLLSNTAITLPSLMQIIVKLNRFGGKSAAEEIHRLFQSKPGDARVRLRVEKAKDFSVTLDLVDKVCPDKEFRTAVETLCGPDSLEVMG
jgi:DNA polymerase III subunit alpha